MADIRSLELKKFDDLCDRYWERFHVAYGVAYGLTENWPLEKHIELLEEALRTDVPINIRAVLGLGDSLDPNNIVL